MLHVAPASAESMTPQALFAANGQCGHRLRALIWIKPHSQRVRMMAAEWTIGRESEVKWLDRIRVGRYTGLAELSLPGSNICKKFREANRNPEFFDAAALAWRAGMSPLQFGMMCELALNEHVSISDATDLATQRMLAFGRPPSGGKPKRRNDLPIAG